METILNQYIKELITNYPGIIPVLNQFKIGCTTCSVGTCRLRDIIEIHGLSVENEYTLFKNIADIIYPGQNIEIPYLPRKSSEKNDIRKFSPPIQMLVDEHTTIKRVLAAVPSIIAYAKKDFADVKLPLQEILNFIRNYADKFHHAKEEDLLFKLFDEKMEIISTMYEEHEVGRLYVRKAAGALDIGDLDTMSANLIEYTTLLTEHIRKEDEILYPWMDRTLTDHQIGVLYSKCITVASSFGEEIKKLTTFAKSIS
jgi:hemerythrin-like domain-containing protein